MPHPSAKARSSEPSFLPSHSRTKIDCPIWLIRSWLLPLVPDTWLMTSDSLTFFCFKTTALRLGGRRRASRPGPENTRTIERLAHRGLRVEADKERPSSPSESSQLVAYVLEVDQIADVNFPCYGATHFPDTSRCICGVLVIDHRRNISA